MFLNDIRELLARDPFEPFRIKLVSGDAHDIFSPAVFHIMADEERCFHASGDGTGYLFAVKYIVSLEAIFGGHPTPDLE